MLTVLSLLYSLLQKPFVFLSILENHTSIFILVKGIDVLLFQDGSAHILIFISINSAYLSMCIYSYTWILVNNDECPEFLLSYLLTLWTRTQTSCYNRLNSIFVTIQNIQSIFFFKFVSGCHINENQLVYFPNFFNTRRNVGS